MDTWYHFTSLVSNNKSSACGTLNKKTFKLFGLSHPKSDQRPPKARYKPSKIKFWHKWIPDTTLLLWFPTTKALLVAHSTKKRSNSLASLSHLVILVPKRMTSKCTTGFRKKIKTRTKLQLKKATCYGYDVAQRYLPLPFW